MEERGATLTRFVVDASLTATLIFDDEATHHGAAILEAFAVSDLFVPAHWPLEIGSMLLNGDRRGRLPGGRAHAIQLAARLFAGVTIEPLGLSKTTIDLADAARLTVYDAAYLELAMRLDATLATNDDDLIAACRARGVSVLTTRP